MASAEARMVPSIGDGRPDGRKGAQGLTYLPYLASSRYTAVTPKIQNPPEDTLDPVTDVYYDYGLR